MKKELLALAKRIYGGSTDTWLIILTIIVLFGWGTYSSYLRKDKLIRQGKYTVGLVDKYSFASHNSRYANYSFYVDSVNYVGSIKYSTANQINIMGRKFLVVYSQKDPHVNALILNLALDSIELDTNLDSFIKLNYVINLNESALQLSEVKRIIPNGSR